MYPANFTPQNAHIWKEAYETVLTEKLDYNKLFFKMVKNYKSIATAPSPSWFEEYKDECTKPQKNKALEEIEKLKQTQGCPPPPEFLEAAKRAKLRLAQRHQEMTQEKLKRKLDAMDYIHE